MYHVSYLWRLPSRLRRRARRSRALTMLVLLGAACLLIAPLYMAYKPPGFLIRSFQRRWPDVLFHVSTASRAVALTIDDGPSEHTAEIMQILKDNGAAATFFIIGAQVAGREALLRDLVRNGNELANHAMHDAPSRDLADAVLAAEIRAVEGMLEQAYAAAESTPPPPSPTPPPPPPRYFRPGSGFFSRRMRGTVQRLGYRLVLGDTYPHDAQISLWRLNARHILSMLRPGGIIICHDRRSWTAPMLRSVLPQIKRRGYRILTVTQLLREARP